jgi:3-hydroxybutyryl-CoA dehydrogenase
LFSLLKLRQLNTIIFTRMNTICICGAGTMGSGIAQVAASAGFKTVLYDLNGEMIEKAENKLQKDLDALVAKQKMTPEKKESIFELIVFTSSIEVCRGDVVIEAIVEKMEAKTSLFNQLAELNSTDTVFASNTSSLSVSAIAKQVKHAQRVAGLHFFNPAPVMRLVEVVKGEQTSAATVSFLLELTNRMGKTPVLCKDSPGFIVNRVARPYYIESLRLVEEGLADFETVDRLLEATGFRMGPFKLMDLIGNDVNYAVSCSVYEQLNQPERLRPSDIQKQRVREGKLGKKTGSGYYDYK